VAVAGLGISWLRDNLCMIDGPEQASELAASVPDTGGVYFVPAFSGLLAPRWEDSARGAIVGLTGRLSLGSCRLWGHVALSPGEYKVKLSMLANLSSRVQQPGPHRPRHV